MLSDKRTLGEHKARFHSDDKPFVCNLCDKGFALKRDLDQHVRFHAEKQRCSICDKSFLNIDEHLVSHFPERAKFKCEVCGQGFLKNASLRSHRRMHEKKSYPCKMCSKLLSSMRILKQHMLLHGEHKDDTCLSCPKCDKKFLAKSHLKRHQKEKHGMNTEDIASTAPAAPAATPVPVAQQAIPNAPAIPMMAQSTPFDHHHFMAPRNYRDNYSLDGGYGNFSSLLSRF